MSAATGLPIAFVPGSMSGGGGAAPSPTFQTVTMRELAFAPAITPAALAAGNTNDYNPAGFATTTRVRQAVDPGGSTLTGLAASTDGHIRILENLGPSTLTFSNEDAGSAAANRFTLPGAANFVLPTGGSLMVIYDGTTSRWLAIAQAEGSSAAFTSIALQDLAFTPSITPAALPAGGTNNYNPAGLATTSRIRQATFNGGNGSTLSGLVAQSDGQVRIIENLGLGILVLNNEDTNSAAANRFTLPGGFSETVPVGGAIMLIYDSTSSRWRAIAEVKGGNGIYSSMTIQQLAFTPALTPPALAAGSTNDYNPTSLALFTRLRQAVNAAGSTLTGLQQQPDGSIRVIENLSGGSLTFTNEDAGSAAVNRFTLPGGVSLVLPTGGTLMLIYDVTSARWRAVAQATGGASTFTNLTTQSLALTPAISPAALAAGSTNDYNPAGLSTTSRIRQATNAAGSTLTGLVAQTDGQIRIIENLSGGTLTLANENAGSAAANRFTCPGSVDLAVPVGGTIVLIYDLTGARWRVTAHTTSGGSSTFTSLTTQGFTIAPPLTPAALGGGTTNNYNPAGLATSTWIRQAGVLGSTIGGLVAQPSGAIRFFENIGANDLLFAHNGASAAGNKFFLPGATGQILAAGGTIGFIYDTALDSGNGGWATLTLANFIPQATAFQHLELTPAITPAALAAGNTNDYNPASFGTTTMLRQATNAAGSTLTGLSAQTDGALRVIENLGPARLTLSHENAASAAANRFTCSNDNDLILEIDCTAIAIYDSATSRWRIIAAALVTQPELGLSPAQSPGALAAGNTNDYNPTGLATTSRFRLTPDAGGTSTLTGITAQPDGDIRVLQNLSTTASLTLSPEDTNSAAANRFTLPSGAAFVIAPGGSCAVIYDGTASRWTVLDKAASSSPAGIANTFMFGDGSDGDVTISVDTTLSRHMFYNNLTVNAGINLMPAGYLVCVKGTLTLNGVIHANGTVGATGGAGSNAGGAGGGANQYLSGGSAGGQGNSGGGSASGGAASRAYRGVVITAISGAPAGTAGTNGGAGQGGGGGGGEGTGGSVGAGTTIAESQGDIHDLFNAMNGGYLGRGGSPNSWTSGVGGGGGGGDNVTPRAGGGGGGGGGTVVVRANNIVSGGGGAIQSKGANGGNGSAGAANRVGGGGGGSGGIIVIVQHSGAVPTTSVTGGTGGNPVNAGGKGGDGGVGIVVSGFA